MNQWPWVATDSAYCSVPPIEAWFPNVESKWSTYFPLVRVQLTIGNVTIDPTVAMSAMLLEQYGHTAHFLSGGAAVPTTMDPTMMMSPPPSMPNVTVTLINSHFCSYGFTFILEAITGYTLAVISLICFLLLAINSRKHFHRKLLFFLLMSVGVVRGVFGHLGCNRIALVDRYFDTLHIMPWFFNYSIPMNMLGDLLTVYVDILLTFFWLQFVAPKWSRGHWGTFTPVAFAVLSALVGLVTFVADYHEVHGLEELSNGNVYYRSVGYISALLLASSILHSVVVAMLLKQLLTQQSYLSELSPRMRRNIIVVGVIGFISVICGIIRGVVLLGHAVQSPAFLDGAFSFDNPAFTTAYFIVFMNIPCLVISISFFVLSWELLKAPIAAAGDDDSDGVYSVISDGDGVRISFLYDKRMNSSVTSTPSPSVSQFLKAQSPTDPQTPLSDGTLPSQQRFATMNSSSAMFATGGGPSGRSGGFSKSKRLIDDLQE